MDQTTLIVLLVGIFLTVIGMVGVYLREISIIKGDITEIKTTIKPVPEIQREVNRLAADTTTFWRILEPSLSNIIHSPTHKRRDDLVDQFVEGKLNETHLLELRSYLKDLLNEVPRDSVKHLAGALLLGRVESQLTILHAQQHLEDDDPVGNDC